MHKQYLLFIYNIYIVNIAQAEIFFHHLRLCFFVVPLKSSWLDIYKIPKEFWINEIEIADNKAREQLKQVIINIPKLLYHFVYE